MVVGLSRAGVTLFWQGEPARTGGRGAYAPAAAALLAASPLLVLLAGPLAGYTETLALQLLDGDDYISAIKGLEPVDPPSASTHETHGGSQ